MPIRYVDCFIAEILFNIIEYHKFNQFNYEHNGSRILDAIGHENTVVVVVVFVSKRKSKMKIYVNSLSSVPINDWTARFPLSSYMIRHVSRFIATHVNKMIANTALYLYAFDAFYILKWIIFFHPPPFTRNDCVVKYWCGSAPNRCGCKVISMVIHISRSQFIHFLFSLRCEYSVIL